MMDKFTRMSDKSSMRFKAQNRDKKYLAVPTQRKKKLVIVMCNDD